MANLADHKLRSALTNVALPLLYGGRPRSERFAMARHAPDLSGWGSATASTTAPTSSPVGSASGWPSDGVGAGAGREGEQQQGP